MFLSIKEAFGGEVNFTKEFAKNTEYQQALFDVIGFRYDSEDENLKIIAEDPIPGGRIDDMVYYDGEPQLAIECQDTKGMLDMLHATKIVGYMAYKKVTDGVIICEDYEQWLVDMVREKFVDRVFIVSPIIVQPDKKFPPTIKFMLVYKPDSMEKANRVAKNTIQSTTNGVPNRIKFPDNDVPKALESEDRYSLWVIKTPTGETHNQACDRFAGRFKGKKAVEKTAINYCNSDKILSKVGYDYTKLSATFVKSGNNKKDLK